MPRAIGANRIYKEAEHQRRLLTPSILRPDIWLDASDLSTIVTSNNVVSQLIDKTGNGNHFSQSTNSARPSISAWGDTGGSCLLFDGVDDNLTNSGFSGPTSYSIFIASRRLSATGADGSGYQRIFHAGASPQDLRLFFGGQGGNLAVFVGFGSGWRDVAACTPTSSIASANILYATNDNTATGLIPYINGRKLNAKDGRTTTFTGAIIGTNQAGTQLMNMHFGELLFFSRVLSEIEVDRVSGYLAWKWGIQSSLFSTHPFFTRPPMIRD